MRQPDFQPPLAPPRAVTIVVCGVALALAISTILLIGQVRKLAADCPLDLRLRSFDRASR